MAVTWGSCADNISTISTRVNATHDDVRDYPDDESFDTGYEDLAWPADRRWRPATAVVAGVVALGAIATAVIINSGDSASTKATVGAPSPRPVITTRQTTPPIPSPHLSPRPSPGPSQTPQLPPETVSTVPPSTKPSAAPPRTPTAAPPLPVLPPTAAVNPRTVVYSVTGTKQLFDLVNIIYTDERGFPATAFNVSLPWTKAVVLNPGVQTESVVATSFYGHLNCSIVNAAGQPVVVKTPNAVIATCTP